MKNILFKMPLLDSTAIYQNCAGNLTFIIVKDRQIGCFEKLSY